MLPLEWTDVVSLVSFVLSIWWGATSHSKSFAVDSDKVDVSYLGKANHLRRHIFKPPRSRFLVVALLELEDGEIVPGNNEVPGPWIGASFCTERTAFFSSLSKTVHTQYSQNCHDLRRNGRQSLCISRYVVSGIQVRISCDQF
jgi:hypothetical protein